MSKSVYEPRFQINWEKDDSPFPPDFDWQEWEKEQEDLPEELSF